MSSNTSDTTTSLGSLVTSIGNTLGKDGSPSPNSSNVEIAGPSGPPPPLPEPSKSAQKIVDGETRHWLALMRYQTHLPPEVDRRRAQDCVQGALERARQALLPANSDQIVKAISMMADMIQCSLPEPDGITLYVAVLQDLGHEAIRRACMDICKTHPYPRLPLPSEILKAGALPQAELMFWHQQLERALLLLSKEEP